MMTTLFWVIVLRGGEILAAGALTLVIGCLVAGVMRRFLGRDRVRDFFAGSGWLPLVKAWVLGMLLPVCSLGSIPIMSEMKKSGVSTGTILAFGLTAPLFNPVSVLYGLTLASPWVVIIFSLCSLTLVSIVGFLFDYLFPEANRPESEPPMEPGIKRILAVFESTLGQLSGFNLVCVLVGMAGAIGLSLVLPNASLQEAVEPDHWFAPLLMLVVAIPMYLSPIAAMVQVAGMFEHGNSVGAALTLLIVGAGLNIGTLVWAIQSLGWRRALPFLGIMLGVVTVLAYLVDRPLYPTDVEPVGHTHAFDQFCFPVPEGYELEGSLVWFQLKKLFGEISVLAGSGFLLVILLGSVLLRGLGSPARRLQWLQASRAAGWKYDRILSPRTLTLVSFLGLLGGSILGCFVYYPPQTEIFKELQSVNIRLGSAVLSENWPEATHWVPEAENWVHKLAVSGFLRGMQRSEYQQAKTDVFLEHLERLEHAIEEREAGEARLLALQCQTDLRRFKRAWLTPDPREKP